MAPAAAAYNLELVKNKTEAEQAGQNKEPATVDQ